MESGAEFGGLDLNGNVGGNVGEALLSHIHSSVNGAFKILYCIP